MSSLRFRESRHKKSIVVYKSRVPFNFSLSMSNSTVFKMSFLFNCIENCCNLDYRWSLLFSFVICTGQMLAGIHYRYPMYYITLHNLESTQEEDWERNKWIVQTITIQLTQIQFYASINLIHTITTDMVNCIQPLIYSTINVLPK